ncbi:hypothetical protein R3P38DRAFT_2466150, partial [Favolaschia claudopus]
STISQLRTDHSPLNFRRFKSGFVDSPSCPACGAVSETRTHFVLDCPVWEPLRQPIRAAGIYGSLHLSTLLSNPKLLKPLGVFIEATGRFA